MVISFCGFRRRARPKGSPANASENGSYVLINKLLAAMKVKKRPEKKQELQLCSDKCKIMTLEDLIASSPALNTTYDCIKSGGEMNVQKQSSRKIHPSSDGELKLPILPISMRSGDQLKNGGVEAESSSFCTTTTAKTKKKKKKKKKVSFRSPEVADVFVLCHSPEIDT